MTKHYVIKDDVCAGHCADCSKHKNFKNADTARTIRGGLEEQGYARFSLQDECEHYSLPLDAIRSAAAAMPLDRTDGGVGRARLYGRGLLLPWLPVGNELHFEPGRVYEFNDTFGIEYSQPASVNSVAAGKRRVFKAFDARLYDNPLMVDLVRLLWLAMPFDHDTKNSAMFVGMHLIKLSPSGEIPAVASPDLVHRDGESFTAGILIDRINVDGGFNAVTHTRWHDRRFDEVPTPDIFEKFTLEAPLEGYVVQDDRVAHYVSPVASIDSDRHAERTILLIDFTPARPAINLSGIH